MKRRQLPLPVLETRFPAYRQLGRAERSRIPSATLDHLGKDPAEQMDYRSLEWILTDPRGVYFPISTSGADPVESPLNQAQALCNKAFHAPYLHADRIAFAKQALAIDADRCADAHILLAEEEAPALDQAITYYQQATKAGLRAVLECNRDILTTPPTPDDDRWEYLPLRPYLRALAGLGCTLFKQGSMEKCCEWLERYLRLDRDDTLLCRPVWLAAKFYLRDWQAIDGFLDDWRPTGADSATANASMFYIYSLVRHQLHGQLGRNDEKLDEITELAFECNIHIAMLLLGKSRISFTQIPLPNTIHYGYLSEAVWFCQLFRGLVMCDYLNEYLLPRFRAYLKRNGWTASELATHCLTAALYASFNGQVPIESLSSSATADSAPKAIGTIPRTDKPASLLDR